MRVLVIGDIHGCSRALDLILGAVKPTADDHLILLGDYVDRGPDSSGVMQRLLALEKQCRLTALRGNHEKMMVDARTDATAEKDWLACGGKPTLASYSVLGDAGKLVDVPDEHWAFMEERCLNWFEIATHFFVHANALADVPLEEQSEYVLLWEKLEHPSPHCSGKVMVCGHTPQRSGNPLNLGHTICLDTGAYRGDWLTCWDIGSGTIWQGNQNGELREAHIGDFKVDQ